MEIGLTNKGAIALVRDTERFTQRIKKDLRVRVAELARGAIVRRIWRLKTTPAGVAWKRWSVNYAKTRGPTDTLLRSSAPTLVSSIKVDNRPFRGAGGRFEAETRVYTDDPRAAPLNDGSDKRNIPAREFFGLSASDAGDIRAAIYNWVRRGGNV